MIWADVDAFVRSCFLRFPVPQSIVSISLLVIICAYYFVRIRGCYQLSSSEETSIRKSLCRSSMLVSSEKFGGTKWSYRIFRICRMEYYYFLDIIPKKGGAYRLLVLRRNLLPWKGREKDFLYCARICCIGGVLEFLFLGY